MHAMSLSHAWHQWRERPVPKTAAPAQSILQSGQATALADEPERPGLRAVHWLPLVVPGMAVLLLICASLIGSVLR